MQSLVMFVDIVWLCQYPTEQTGHQLSVFAFKIFTDRTAINLRLIS